ncbi:hypothetical protein TNCV_1985121 [Trichonephila clavipes]|nr:hypothetical protein TNCV_1985121 [Trichonephila clavipes]
MMDRISICEALAKPNEIDQFLKWMVTEDEKWVTYYCAKTIMVKVRGSNSNGGQTRTNGKEGSTVYLGGLERNHLLGDASAWPNTKFRSLLSTTGPFEASDCPEMAKIGQQKRCCVP